MQLSNGIFANNITGWLDNNSTSAWNPLGYIDIVYPGSGSGAYRTFATAIGVTYKVMACSRIVSIDHLLRVGNGSIPDAGIVSSTPTDIPTRHEVEFTAVGTTSYVYLRGGALGTISWDNISVRKVDPLVNNNDQYFFGSKDGRPKEKFDYENPIIDPCLGEALVRVGKAEYVLDIDDDAVVLDIDDDKKVYSEIE